MASPRPFPALPVQQLQLRDVEGIFHLTQRRKTDWVQIQAPCEIPDCCNKTLDMIDRSVSESDGVHEVALKLRLAVFLGASFSTTPDQQAGLPQIKIHGKCRFSFEPVEYKGSTYCLQGLPCFSLWYRLYGMGLSDVAVNFVIVEQDKGKSSHGIPQALACMGMVHRQRQYEKRASHAVFGLSTDHDQFHFLQIDVKGKWSQVDMNSSHRQQIADTLTYIHKQASILSTVEERTSATPRNRVHDVACTLCCLWQVSRKPDKNWSVFSAGYDIHGTEKLEEGEDQTQEL